MASAHSVSRGGERERERNGERTVWSIGAPRGAPVSTQLGHGALPLGSGFRVFYATGGIELERRDRERERRARRRGLL